MSALPLQSLSARLQWLAKGLGSCNVLLVTYAGTAARCKAVGREEGIPTPINLQDHKCFSDFPGPGLSLWLNTCLSSSARGNPAVGKERGQGKGTRAIPLTVVPGCVVPAAQALSSVGVAVISVAIAVAGLAAGEAPEAGQAAVALPPVHPREAVALARLHVTEGVVRASDVTLARCKESRTGAEFP